MHDVLEASVMKRFKTRSNHETAVATAVALRTTKGKPALTPATTKILDRGSSFEKTIFLSLERWNAESAEFSSMKMFKAHLSYLCFLGCLVIVGKKNFRGKVVNEYRVATPPPGPVMPYSEFMKTVLKDPRYVKKGVKKMSEDTQKPSADAGKIYPVPTVNFTPVGGVKFTPQAVAVKPFSEPSSKNHLKSSFGSSDDFLDFDTGFDLDKSPVPTAVPSPRATEAGQTAGQPASSATPRTGGFDLTIEEKTENSLSKAEGGRKEFSEPMEKKRQKKPKTQGERQAVAVAKINKGHLINPLGQVDNGARRHKKAQARTISPEGKVTQAQLFAHLVKCFDNAFGEGIIEDQLASDKSAFGAWISSMKQKFIDTCNYNPSNRELSEYVEWLASPQQSKSLLNLSKTASNPKALYVSQLLGTIWIRTYFDRVLSKKITAMPSPVDRKMTEIRGIMGKLDEAYSSYEKNKQNDFSTALTAISTGYVIMASWLHDEGGLDESECKQRIIDVMTRFVRGAVDKTKAKDLVRNEAITNTRANSSIYEDVVVFKDWEGTCNDIVSVVLEQTESAQ